MFQPRQQRQHGMATWLGGDWWRFRLSDPPVPPGEPNEEPDPDEPPPIEEPPPPIPIPRDPPRPPLHAAPPD